MKRTAAALLALVLAVCSLAVCASAQAASFELTENTMSQLSPELLEYMPEQRFFHFLNSGSVSAEIPVSGGIYLYITAGGYHSPANGVTDNGINRVCVVKLTFFDENDEVVVMPFNNSDAVINIPADGMFHRWSIGNDAMYAGLPDNVKRAVLTVSAENDTAYIKSMYIGSSDTTARDMSALEWTVNDMGSINAQTSRADFLIMLGFVCAVAVIMMIFAKFRKKYRKGK